MRVFFSFSLNSHSQHSTENFANFLAYLKKKQYLCSRKGVMNEFSTYQPDFEEYIRQGEPGKKERAQI